MFVRWQRREQRIRGTWGKREEREGGGWSWIESDRVGEGEYLGYVGSTPTGVVTRTALLIQSVRTPAGPRHRYLATLGKYQEGKERDRQERNQFWITTMVGLDQAGVEGKERRKIVAALAKVIRKPSSS
jgi:hypothetical protein